ncbi:phosphatase PAP2 family protein [Dickeya dadantii]|uniref:hypothetical protein n=1 Tax=Dickeya dadantii TaxID=204038 RepID=UPI001CC81F4B|nr:hypothetical protein [Dickeya dadantii]UAY96974.1 hypothetical protein KTF62_03415 [Dickeya dadantii]
MKKQPKIFPGLGICLAVLLVVPGIAWMTGWQWNPDAPSRLLTFFYFLTQTVSNPFGIITALFLLGALLWRLKPAKTLVWRCALLIIAPILLGQVSVGVLKRAVPSDRTGSERSPPRRNGVHSNTLSRPNAATHY